MLFGDSWSVLQHDTIRRTSLTQFYLYWQLLMTHNPQVQADGASGYESQQP
jgi:hypothetical protein